MNPWIGWSLAAVFFYIAWQQYGTQGVLFASGAVVFWLLLQFNRVMRVMRGAGQSPVGKVGSAVMLNARLKAGMRMLDVVSLTRSLGERASEQPEVWRWRDDGGSTVDLEFQRGKLSRWTLERPPQPDEAPPAANVAE